MANILRAESIPEADFLRFSGVLLDREIADEPTESEFKRKELNGELLVEPLLKEDQSRFVLFPIKQADVRAY